MQNIENTSFDKIAHEYDKSIPKHIRDHYLHKRFNFIKELIKPPANILDIGCGTGVLGEKFVKAGYEVSGIDASKEMLAYAERRGLKIFHASCETLPFKDKTFDLCYSVAVFHHLVDPLTVKKTLSEMVRITKQNGIIVIWDHNPLNPYWPVIMKKVPQDSGEERLISIKEILNGVKDHNVSKVKISRKGFIADFFPEWFMPVASKLENLFEKLPTRYFAAHNVVVLRRN